MSSTARSDIGLAADLATLALAVIAAVAWLAQGGHWVVVVAVASALSWVLTLGLLLRIVQVHRRQPAPPALMMVISALVIGFIVLVVALTITVGIIFDWRLPLEIGGLILLVLPGLFASAGIHERYHEKASLNRLT